MTNLPIPQPQELREELLKKVTLDLLGPAGGPDEELDEGRVLDRYLVGVLAPRHQELSPEEFDELAQGGPGAAEEGTTEPTTLPAKSMFPASFGTTFCVDIHAKELKISARWGQYTRQRSETLTGKSGEFKLVWKRTQREGTLSAVPLKVGRLKKLKPVPDCPEVLVQGLIRMREDHWSVTLFLVNAQEEPGKSKDQAWLFQPELIVESPDGSPVFHRRPCQRALGKADPAAYKEEQTMEMLYRHHVEFAVGHGVSVHAETPEGMKDRAVRISTRVIPAYEVPKVTPPTSEDIPALKDLTLDMRDLADTEPSEFATKLGPLLTGYEAWISEQESQIGTPEMAVHKETAKAAIAECRQALSRIKEGVELLGKSEQAAEAFKFANKAMWLQRVRTIYSLAKRRGEDPRLEEIDVPVNRSWYPFQLAFILLNLPGITDLQHPDRTDETSALADLLWFPTGGGKSEAYLGLSAYTLALRRLQGTVAGRPGDQGVAVLMRYTLRLLTIQQFQRATALVCACEVIRREALAEGDTRWGATPFRIGLWVGQHSTPNRTEDAAEVIRQDHGDKYHPGIKGTPAQLTTCPWCGAAIVPGRDIIVETYSQGRCRTLMYCSDVLGQCPFSRKQAAEEGLPVLVVDEEIYRRLPSILIATVDKFAQMPWNGKIQMLFGQVESHCERHGFRSPEIEDADSHPKKGNHPKAKTVPHVPLRPPDLIIQDELHLISGPLGTLVGLYETAVDFLCSWEVDGKTVWPKVIASTATIRKAQDQINATFLRKVSIFPPQGLDIRGNFFSVQRPPSPEYPGRLYLGICAPGRRLKAGLIRVYLAFLAAGQQLYEKYGKSADPWMTLVGYFNSIRELGGMRRLVEDDVRTRLGKMDTRGLAKRSFHNIEELTSRKSSADIPKVLDLMEVPFDPVADAQRKKERGRSGLPSPVDVLLATNMVSVGVDVQRLGLMVVAGQPKTTAEYIQATSRIGRKFPGIVCTVYNWARPRDLSHYETFEHYHATFYKHVEAMSVTPFAAGAIDRGLTALLVSLIRLRGTEFNANDKASRIDRKHPYVREALEIIARRASLAGTERGVETLVRAELNERLDEWLAEAQDKTGGRTLGYDVQRDGTTVALLERPGRQEWHDFTCLNSLRDVEPMVGLILNDGGLDDTPAAGADEEVQS